MKPRTTCRWRTASLVLVTLGFCAACKYDWDTPPLPDAGDDASPGVGGGWNQGGASGQGGYGLGGFGGAAEGGAAGNGVGGSDVTCANVGSDIEYAIAMGKLCATPDDCTQSVVDPCGCLQFLNSSTWLADLETDLKSYQDAACTGGYTCPTTCADAGVADCVGSKCTP